MAELTQPIEPDPIESDAGGMVSACDERCVTRTVAEGGCRGAPAHATRTAAGHRDRKRHARAAGTVILGQRGAIHIDAVTYELARRLWASARSTPQRGSGLRPQAAFIRETMKPITAAG
jgi:hypothetical protein